MYISLRFFGFFVYDKELDLHDKWHTNYVIKMRYDRWETPGSQRIFIGKVDLLGVEYRCTSYIVFAWGLKRELQQDMCEITEIELCANFSLLLCAPEGRSRNALQKRYNPPKPTPVVEDVTVDARELYVTAPVAPENIDVTPVARKASAPEVLINNNESNAYMIAKAFCLNTEELFFLDPRIQMGSRGRRRGVVSQHSGCGLFYSSSPHIHIFFLANI